MDSGRDMKRPWYYFDLVEPVVKFRFMGDEAPRAETVDVPAGEGLLEDEPADGTMPVEVIEHP